MNILEALEMVDPDTMPHGKYTVELFNERGRKIEHIESPNYITPYHKAAMLRYQMALWGMNNYTVSGGTVRTPKDYFRDVADCWMNPLTLLPWPNDGLIASDDASAIDTNRSWMTGQPVAFGVCWKANVNPTGRRGQINEAECLVSNYGLTQKWVWDYLTGQGNGTFQSLCFGSIGDLTQGTPNCMVGAHSIWLPPANGRVDATNYAAWMNYASPFYDDGTTLWWVGTDGPSTTNHMVKSMAKSALTVAERGIDHCVNAYAATVTNGPTISGLTWGTSAAQSIYYGQILGFTRLGPSGDGVVFQSYASTAGWTLKRFNMSTGAQVWGTPANIGGQTTPGSAQSWNSLIYISGTGELYLTNQGSNMRNNIYRIDVNNGSTLTTIALPVVNSVQMVVNGGMVTDGTYAYLYTNFGLVKISFPTPSTISIVNWLGFYISARASETGQSPWNTGANARYTSYDSSQVYYYASMVDTAVYKITSSLMTNDSGRTYRDGGGQQTGLALTYFNNRLWFHGGYPATVTTSLGGVSGTDGTGSNWHNRLCLFSIDGNNMLSRTLLGSPVTKTSSQTMKLSYELTMPDISAAWPVHELAP